MAMMCPKKSLHPMRGVALDLSRSRGLFSVAVPAWLGSSRRHLFMLAYKVTINGNHIATVGMNEDGLLFLKASWMRLKEAEGISFPCEGDTQFTISGLRDKTDEHLEWYYKDLTVGDKITLELLETDVVDAPAKIERQLKT
jgi:hypothetical protein